MRVTVESEQRAEEAALVQAARSGDRVAFGALYTQYGGVIHAVLISRVSFGDAEDLVQEVFLRAMERLPDLKDVQAFPAWLFSIARRMATDYARQRRTTCAVDHIASTRPRPDGEAFAVLRQIQSLPETYRDTLILRLVEGMTGPEIAQRTGLTCDSVRVNLCRGTKLLREKLEGGLK